MAFTFDATLKDLASHGPVDFLTAFDGSPSLPVVSLSVDLSALTKSADVVYGLGGDPPKEVIHFEVQSGPDANLHKHVLVVNTLLFAKYDVPVHSIVLLLRPAAAHKNLNGSIRYTARPDRGKMDFGYEVVPLWEKPSESLLAGGLETVPLATLGQLPEGVSVEDGVAGVLARVLERLTREATPERLKVLLTAAYLLTGLRVARHQLLPLFRGAIRTMHESDTYQAVLEEGEINGLKRTLLRQGGKRFGPPPEEVKLFLEGIMDLERLDRMIDRVHDIAGWQELLETP